MLCWGRREEMRGEDLTWCGARQEKAKCGDTQGRSSSIRRDCDAAVNDVTFSDLKRPSLLKLKRHPLISTPCFDFFFIVYEIFKFTQIQNKTKWKKVRWPTKWARHQNLILVRDKLSEFNLIGSFQAL